MPQEVLLAGKRPPGCGENDMVCDVEVLRVDPGHRALAGPGGQQHAAQRGSAIQARGRITGRKNGDGTRNTQCGSNSVCTASQHTRPGTQ